MVKNPPANAGDADSIPCWEDPLEKEMATHSSILAWIIPWTEEPGGLESMRSQRITTQRRTKRLRGHRDTTEKLSMHACLQYLS